MSSTVAIIGRPNVGKSTLFNRLAGRRLALVDDRPGVTRDRREGEAKLAGLRFTIIDTAGLEDAGDETLAGRMRQQTDAAIEQADVCLFMIDARAGLTPMDEYFAGILRKHGKPVILLANKSEGKAGESGLLEAYSLGLGEPVALSAEHGEGLGDLHDALEPLLAKGTSAGPDGEAGPDRPLRLAIVGRPNAGKSTLINKLVGEDRLLTGPEAGITRDAIAIDWEWQGQQIKLWDTAGMRRRSRVTDKLEKLSVADGKRAVQFAEVVVLLLDATQALEKQDLTIADQVAQEGRALVLAVNKWDVVADKQAARRTLDEEVERLLPQLAGVPVVTLSAKTGAGLGKLMPAVMKIYDIWNSRISTAKLNQWLDFQISRHPPPAPSGRRIKLRYMTQARARPPTFALFCSAPQGLPESYKRYLVNGLREDFGLRGVPIRINLRKGKNPYV
ncbi:MAG: ribosome biogenesis GTPase Der [Hyphomicrobiales bacterium]|nr:ribosome biogenesis GTPase Der [Hyphomicrobiales bacterium]